jgi:hypothetical protein
MASAVIASEFARVSDLIAAAKTELGLYAITVQASNDRTYEEALKNIFDAINNDETIFTFTV